MTASARHSKAQVRWGTSVEYVERARTALGGRIELDPMSEPAFNTVVRAERIWTEQDDGLAQSWAASTALVNPAGGLVVEAWCKLVAEHAEGALRKAVWIGFSVEQLCLLADEPFHPADFSLLICRKRISFVRHDGKQGSPSHGNYVCGLGIAPYVFEAAFAGLGRISHGRMVSVTAQHRRSA